MPKAITTHTISSITSDTPFFIIPSIIEYTKYDIPTTSPAITTILKSLRKDSTNESNADDSVLNIIPSKKNNKLNAADQNIINATKTLPPYSIVAVFILSAALFISSSLI